MFRDKTLEQFHVRHVLWATFDILAVNTSGDLSGEMPYEKLCTTHTSHPPTNFASCKFKTTAAKGGQLVKLKARWTGSIYPAACYF